jgi:hypothetical protein
MIRGRGLIAVVVNRSCEYGLADFFLPKENAAFFDFL